jgi:hypothetical protein
MIWLLSSHSSSDHFVASLTLLAYNAAVLEDADLILISNKPAWLTEKGMMLHLECSFNLVHAT